jgi:hypothetical protein
MIGAALARWVFHRPWWLFPLRLAVLVLIIDLGARMVGA